MLRGDVLSWVACILEAPISPVRGRVEAIADKQSWTLPTWSQGSVSHPGTPAPLLPRHGSATGDGWGEARG